MKKKQRQDKSTASCQTSDNDKKGGKWSNGISIGISILAFFLSVGSLASSCTWREEDRDLPAKAVMLEADANTVGDVQHVTVYNGGALPVNRIYLEVSQDARGIQESGALTQSSLGQHTTCWRGSDTNLLYLYLPYIRSGEKFAFTVQGSYSGTGDSDAISNFEGLRVYFRDAWSQWWSLEVDGVPEEENIDDEVAFFGDCYRLENEITEKRTEPSN